MLKVQCKHCASTIEVPIPEPKTVEKIVEKPCECGLTEGARSSRHIAVTVSLIAICAILSGLGGCWVSGHTEVEKTKVDMAKFQSQAEQSKAQAEQAKAEAAKAQAEAEKYRVEAQKYKDVLIELKSLPDKK